MSTPTTEQPTRYSGTCQHCGTEVHVPATVQDARLAVLELVLYHQTRQCPDRDTEDALHIPGVEAYRSQP